MFAVEKDEAVLMTLNLNYVTLIQRDLGNGKMSCSSTSHYDCLQSAAKAVSEKIGCRTPWTMNFDLPVCDNQTVSLKESYKTYEEAILNENKLCPDMCRSLETSLFKVNTRSRSDGRALFGIYTPRTITITEEHYLYTSVNLFAEIGGYLGLFMGYSLFNIANIFGQFLDMKIKSLEIASEQNIPI